MFKPYPTYKYSSVPWLGEVPEHWEVKRNKLFLREVNDRSEDGTEELLTVSQYTGITKRRARLANESDLLTNASSLVGYKRVMPGDIIMNIMLSWNGSLGVSAVEGIASPAYCVFRTKSGIEPRFLHYLLRTSLFTGAFKTVSTGVVDSRLRLYPDVFFRLPSLIPSLPEQVAIVRYLDYLDSRISRFIHAKQKLIKLLEEQKQAIIHRAVTRGLNPNVRFKPSGAEWLGDIPEHWDVVSLRFRYIQCLGKMLDSKRVLGIHPLPYLRNTDVQWCRINVSDLPEMDIAPYEYERYTIRSGDLLVCEGGEVGRSAIWSGETGNYGFQKAIHRLRPRSPAHDLPLYLNYVLRLAAQAGAFNDGHKSTIPHLTGDKLRAHRFPFPNKAEQAAIVRYLDNATSNITAAIERAQSEISLLREYRTRLIADVVTGKVDVREVAARLPDQAEEPEPLDEATILSDTLEETEKGEEMEE